MNHFDIEAHLQEFYSSFPEGRRQPIIGITADYADGDVTLRERYHEQVVKAGGTPVIIPPVTDKDVLINTLEHIDGLILTGGGDLNPLWMGEEPSPDLHKVNATRDLPELLIIRLAYNRQIPILGICRGMQVMAAALGGKVTQDISLSPTPSPIGKGNERRIKHSQDADKWEATHTVEISRCSYLFDIYKDADNVATIAVNSFHHQAVVEPGKRFRATAFAPDGVIEAMESIEYKSIMGVQWHPEWLGDDGLKIFAWLVEHSREFSEAKRLHRRILTLDTHCDTPMLFPQGVRFDRRDPRILYDLHKMTEGRQDAVTMVAYLPQPKPGEEFGQKVDIAGILKNNPDLTDYDVSISPTQFADMIFDKIGSIVERNRQYIGIARTAEDLYKNKAQGRKSIMLGIENGLALNHDLDNVSHFAQRGVVYITLCHNGDNDICDSARGCDTHNGVSAFGEQVIRRMNDEGIMVDLSHGGEKSFYDALDISRVPIVCSHSNAKALCDVPRNLTDDQLRALAKKGGVAHVTLYHGFLRCEGEASVLDGIEHLEHFIRIMGIDHVGIGTDFDGDGTVSGCADASELINFTRHLMRRRYSEADIEKIWGGDWLRVMTQIQNERK